MSDIVSVLNGVVSNGGLFLGYVGPGAGLSMMGALLAVGLVMSVAIIAPILYPIRVVRSWLRNRRTSGSEQT